MKGSMIFVGLVVLLYLVAWGSGYQIAVNPTTSMPRGLYLLMPVKDFSRGSLIAACIPDKKTATLYVKRGYLPASQRCASGAAPIIKPIAAVPGDTVKLDDSGVSINNHNIDHSKTEDLDSDGRSIPHLLPGIINLANDHFFVMSTHSARSLDSRYFGPIQKMDAIGQVKPIYTE